MTAGDDGRFYPRPLFQQLLLETYREQPVVAPDNSGGWDV